LLIEVSARLTSQLRKSDLAARLGGDEFAVVLCADAAESAAVAEKLSRLLADPYTIDGIELHSGASIGIATYPASGMTIDSLLAAADEAMYAVKAARKSS
jgi:diguanylate cyclase (GGDEF)-like protein